MHSPVVSLLLLLLVCTLLHAATLNSAERTTLVNLYYSTTGDYWERRDNWLSGDPCTNQWWGVTCNSNGAHVFQLYVIFEYV